jgi:hypothetical protein
MNGRITMRRSGFGQIALLAFLPFVISSCTSEPERGLDGKPITGYSGLSTCEDFLEKASSLADAYNNYEYQNYGQETVLEDGTTVPLDGNKIIRNNILYSWARTVLGSPEGCFPSDQVNEAYEVKESSPHMPW